MANLLVYGNEIGEDLAAEILLRTDDLAPCFHGDSKYHGLFRQVFGLPEDVNDLVDDSPEVLELEKGLRRVSLSVLFNNKIISDLGLRGWLSWSGQIFSNNIIFNNDRVPDLLEDMSIIGFHWPSIEMTCQVIYEDRIETYCLKNGKVEQFEGEQMFPCVCCPYQIAAEIFQMRVGILPAQLHGKLKAFRNRSLRYS